MHKISLATQSLWDRPLAEAVDVAARVGYDGVEIVCHDPFLPLAELRKQSATLPRKLQDLSLEVASLTVITDFVTPETIEENRQFLQSIIDLAEPFNTALIKISPGSPLSSQATEQQWNLAINHIRVCADYADRKSVSLAIETHLNQLSDVTDGALRLIEGIRRPNVGVVIDWCNLYVDGDDPVEGTRRLGPHIRLVHAKDGHLTSESPRWDPIGEGELDYPVLLGALCDTGYRGYISVESLIQDERYNFTGRTTDPEEIVTRDLAALRRLIEKYAATT